MLAELGAVDEEKSLTSVGQELARLPLDPRVARMLVAAREEGCLAQVRIIAAALSVQDPRQRPLERAAAADERHARFADEQSDFLSFLKLWKLQEESGLRRICRDNFLSYPRMREWRDVHEQLKQTLDWPESAVKAGKGRGLSRDPPRAARRAARQRGNARRGRCVYRRARHQVLGASRLVDQEAGQVDRRRRAGGDHAALRALGRRHRAALAGGDRVASPQAQPQRPALGEGPRRGGRARARHALRPAGVCESARAVRAARSGSRARHLHPLGAGGGRFRHARALLRAQPAPGRRDRAPRAQVAPPGHPGGRGADPRVLRRAHSQGNQFCKSDSNTGDARRRPRGRASCTSRART